MKRFNIHMLAVAFSVAAASAVAADFDGSKPLICSAIESHDCAVGGDCLRGLAEDINAPQFIRLDFAEEDDERARPQHPDEEFSARRWHAGDPGVRE